MPRVSTRLHWIVLTALLAGCGGSAKKKPRPKAEPEKPAPTIELAGALKETPGLGRTAELTALSDDEMVEQGYLYIGTVSAPPGPDTQPALLAAAGAHGGELVRPITPESVDVLGVTQGGCADNAAADAKDPKKKDGQESSDQEPEAKKAGEDPGAKKAAEDDSGADKKAEEGSGSKATNDAADASAEPCTDAKPFPMLGMVWGRPVDVPDDVIEKWMMQDGVRKLHSAVAKQDLEDISELVSDGIDINAPDALGRYALYKAALTGDDEYVAMIVGLGANPNPPPMWGRTLLENIVDIELRRYHQGNFPNFDIEAHKRTVAALIGTGTDSSAALRRAVSQGFCETAKHIAKLGAEGEACDEAQKAQEAARKKNALGRAYRVALDEGRLPTVKELLKKGVAIGFVEPGTPWESAPLIKAIADPNPAAVEFLLKKKVKHRFADTPEARALLCAAAKAGNRYLTQNLIKAGLDLTGSLHCAAAGKEAKKMVQTLLAARVDVDGLNGDGETPLYVCIRDSLAELRKKHGYEGDEAPAEPKKVYLSARDALDKSLVKIVNLLVKKGANPKLSPEGAPTAMELAQGHGLKKVSHALKKAGKKKR